MSTNRDSILETIRGIHHYGLANRADVYGPDAEDSPGAVFLSRVRDDVVELLENVDPDSWESTADEGDEAHNIADSAVPIYTGERWRVFADLGAWETDVSDLSSGAEDMTTLAGFALYEVARILVYALITEAVRELEGVTD